MKGISLTLIAALLVLTMGCPTERKALSGARKAVEVAAQTVKLVDEQTADLYEEAAASSLAACDDRACYDARMERWGKAVKATVAMKHSLLTLELALDAWEAGSPNGRADLREAASCFLGSMVTLQGLLWSVGADAPGLTKGINYGSSLFGLTGEECGA